MPLEKQELEEQQKTIAALHTAVQNNPDSFDSHMALGMAYFHAEQLDGAMAAFQQAAVLNPHAAGVHNWMGRVYERRKSVELAVAAYERALALDPQSIAQFDEMIATCLREIEIEDGYDARRLLGYAYDWLGRHDEAIEQLERAITLSPEDYEARGALARVYSTVGRQQEADEQQAIASEMASRDNEYGRACFEAVGSNFEGALTLLEVALRQGQVQSGWARIDPEFAFMIDDPRFKTLIENKPGLEG